MTKYTLEGHLVATELTELGRRISRFQPSRTQAHIGSIATVSYGEDTYVAVESNTVGHQELVKINPRLSLNSLQGLIFEDVTTYFVLNSSLGPEAALLVAKHHFYAFPETSGDTCTWPASSIVKVYTDGNRNLKQWRTPFTVTQRQEFDEPNLNSLSRPDIGGLPCEGKTGDAESYRIEMTDGSTKHWFNVMRLPAALATADHPDEPGCPLIYQCRTPTGGWTKTNLFYTLCPVEEGAGGDKNNDV